MRHTALSSAIFQERTKQWQENEFYRAAIVLGLDIGLDGIGIYLRRGRRRFLRGHLILNCRRRKRWPDGDKNAPGVIVEKTVRHAFAG